jgi:hypothetical protein
LQYENLPIFRFTGEIVSFFSEKLMVLGEKISNTGPCSAHNGVGISKESSAMNAELDIHQSMHWTDDLGGLGFDELRDLPYAVQASMDIAVFE